MQQKLNTDFVWWFILSFGQIILCTYLNPPSGADEVSEVVMAASLLLSMMKKVVMVLTVFVSGFPIRLCLHSPLSCVIFEMFLWRSSLPSHRFLFQLRSLVQLVSEMINAGKVWHSNNDRRLWLNWCAFNLYVILPTPSWYLYLQVRFHIDLNFVVT